MKRVIVILLFQILLFGCNNDEKIEEIELEIQFLLSDKENLDGNLVEIDKGEISISYENGEGIIFSANKKFLSIPSNYKNIEYQLDQLNLNGYVKDSTVTFYLNSKDLYLRDNFPKLFPECKDSDIKYGSGYFWGGNPSNMVRKPYILDACKQLDIVTQIEFQVEPLKGTIRDSIYCKDSTYNYFEPIRLDIQDYVAYNSGYEFYRRFYIPCIMTERMIIKILSITYQKYGTDENYSVNTYITLPYSDLLFQQSNNSNQLELRLFNDIEHDKVVPKRIQLKEAFQSYKLYYL